MTDPPVNDRPRHRRATRIDTREADLAPHQPGRAAKARQVHQLDLMSVFDLPSHTAHHTDPVQRAGLDMDLQRSIDTIDDADHVHVRQADQQLAHASSVLFHEGSRSECLENTQTRRALVPRPRTQPPLRSEAPDLLSSLLGLLR